MRTRVNRIFLATISVVSVLISSCHPFQEQESNSDAVSDRPQKHESGVLFFQLKNPAILSASAIGSDGKIEVPGDLVSAISKEQADFEKTLLGVSGEIRVIYRYRQVGNAIAAFVPGHAIEKVSKLNQVKAVSFPTQIGRPAAIPAAEGTSESMRPSKNYAAELTGVTKAWESVKVPSADGTEIPLKGRGIRIGVIDTGIDYTHKMFGGAGTADAYAAVDPNILGDQGGFPNSKVIGGVDLVGTKFGDPKEGAAGEVPVPDANPLDEAGHGSHVAGIIAGIGDNVSTFDGIAPEASLFALKVFGKDGSTNDMVVSAALEFAADPNGDSDPNDHLDAVNLSLGSSYGAPNSLYEQAISNLTRGGTVVIASAGNSGPKGYIVGAPSTFNEAISVAATVDGTPQNWHRDASRFNWGQDSKLVLVAVGGINKPLSESEGVTGKLIEAGFADVDFSPELADRIKGNIALISRGKVGFVDKVKRAVAAGASGVVVTNNQEGEPIVMGGEVQEPFPITAIMVTKEVGAEIRAKMEAGTDVFAFFTDKEKIETPEMIDTMAPFSSAGPRIFDAAFKPEIGAPGKNILSAKMGGGDQGVLLSGTSMAAPEITGMVALLRQKNSQMSAQEAKARMMTTAKFLKDPRGNSDYALSWQGAGRVQFMEALNLATIANPAGISLGEVSLLNKKVLNHKVRLTNTGDKELTYRIEGSKSEKMIVESPLATLKLVPGESTELDVRVTLVAFDMQGMSADERNGRLTLSADSGELVQIPVLAAVRLTTNLAVPAGVSVLSSADDSADAVSSVNVVNKGKFQGKSYLFNLLGKDAKVESPNSSEALARGLCDLESVGYRIVEKEDANGTRVKHLQFAGKLYQPITNWLGCSFTALIDANGDGVAEQELIATTTNSILPEAGEELIESLLIDASAMRKIRADFEAGTTEALDYRGTILNQSPIDTFDHSTLIIVSAPISSLALRADGKIRVKVGTLGGPEDDFLNRKKAQWEVISADEKGMPFYGMPENTSVGPETNQQVEFHKGLGKGSLIGYFPNNPTATVSFTRDQQSKVLTTKYKF